MQPEQQQRIMGYFIEEAKDHLNTIERGLLNLQSTLINPDMINEVFRAAHSVKGGAAMLGLNAIQHSSHRLEDYFKVLKETPGIQVDQRLESLLLKVFDTLRDLVEQLQGPAGLTEDAANQAMAEVEPVFQEADQYLATLAADAAVSDVVPVPVGYASEQFHERVAADLRAMLELFKQADTLNDARSQLLTLSDRLQSHGESVGLAQWANLMEPVKSALANPDNDYRTLAAVIIKELKQSQDWVKLDQLDRIVPSDSLMALLPLAAETSLSGFDVDMPMDSDWEDASDFASAELDALAADLSNLDADIADVNVSGNDLDDLDLGGFDDAEVSDVGELDFDALLSDDAATSADVPSSHDQLSIALDESSTASLEDLDKLFVGMNERELALMEELESPSNQNLSEADLTHQSAESDRLASASEILGDDAANHEVLFDGSDRAASGDWEVTDLTLDDDALNQAADELSDSLTGSSFMDQTVVEVPGDEWAAGQTQELGEATGAAHDDDLNPDALVDAADDQLAATDLSSEFEAEAAEAAADLATAAGLTEDLNLEFDPMRDNHGGAAIDDANSILVDLALSDAADDPDNAVAEPSVDNADTTVDVIGDSTAIAGDISIDELSDAAILDLADLSLDVDPWDDNPADLDALSQSGENQSADVATSLDDDLSQLLDDTDQAHSDFDLNKLDNDDHSADATVEAGASGDGLDDLDAQVEFDAADAGFDAELDFLLGEASDFADELSDLNLSNATDFDLQTMVGNEDFSQSSDFLQLDELLADEPEMSAGDNDLAALATDPEFDDLDQLLLDDQDAASQSLPVVTSRSAPVTTPRRSPRGGKGFGDQTMRVSVKHLDNLTNLVGELVVNRNSLEQDQERMRQSLDNLLYQVQQLGDVGQRMQDLYERSLLESSLLASRKSRSDLSSPMANHTVSTVMHEDVQDESSYHPLEMDRFTGFHTLSQEMIELIVRVRESASDIEFVVDETDQVTRMFRQVTTQLQEGLTRSRMVPFAQTADRLPRAVRDIAMKVGKQAELVVEGRDTLIDKMILEHLYDPMTHLVNNAITHGIEKPEARRDGAKPDVGRITIRAFHQGNQTVISVSDDGAGIDVDRVRLKAIEKGLISRAEAETMSRLELFDLIFHPGFTTRDRADDFAGRGIGMDVVRTSLTEIRGAVTIDSTPGKGTDFTIRLPLTLSISKALCCISARARIAFPMDGVEDMLDVPQERLSVDAHGQMFVPWRDTMLPLRPLTELLMYNRYMSRGTVYGGNQEEDIISVVVLRSAGNYLALQVDQVLGEQEIVIKQLEGPVPKPVGIAGATVLGDGRIMPIADVLELIDLASGRLRRGTGSMWEQDADQTIVEMPPTKTDPLVLIVDDSITVRELLSMTFNKVGYRVEQARDGQEAWEKLRAGLPCDIVFCDIEMPRMDGLELLSRIQKDPNLQRLPVAMLTSRGADRHQQMANSLGAKGYFTKPYLEEALLDAAARMLKGEVLIG